jgi:TolB-like protein/DNA-binding winged helix-turn-helix (wHTH) protein/Flp pilus assembly protein TadD
MRQSREPEMSDTAEAAHAYRFDAFMLDVGRGTLLGPGGELRLRPKSFELLLYMVRHPGRLVGREELLDAVWGHAAVTDDSITQCLVEIRRALGDESRSLVRTIPRRGYLLDVPVEALPRRDSPPVASEAPPRPPVNRAYAAAAIAGALLLAALAWWASASHSPDPVAGEHRIATPPNSIAVLPFADMSAAGDQAYLGEGIAEEILNLLAQLDSLKVIARTSSFAFQDRAMDVREIAGQLGVTHVLEGSVRRSADRVRITAQLVDGRDGMHQWSQTYDREVGDIFELQLEIAQQVSDVLAAALQVEPLARNRDIRAYEHLLRGRFLFQRRAPGDMERAREHFEAAVALDPEDGAAWAALSGWLTVEISEGRLDVAEALPRALEAAQRAVALSPGLPEAHLRAARAYSFAGDDERAWRHIRIAEALNPEDPLLLGFKAGAALARDDLAGALALQEQVVARDPLSVVTRNNYAYMLQAAGRLAEARAQLQAVVEISPGRQDLNVALARLLVLEGRHEEAVTSLADALRGGEADVVRAVALHALGRMQEAQAALSRLETDASADAAVHLAEFHAQLGDAEAAWRWLDEARRRMQAEMRDNGWRWRQRVRSSSFLRPLESDPRWRESFQASADAG